jgi:DNA-directed RNA polymerase specialized sigma24 family protein
MMKFEQAKGRVTEEHFQILLSLLSDNKDEASEKYELLRMKLFSYFQWNGAEMPEDLADQVIDRVLEQIANGTVIHNINSYTFTIAQHLLHEANKKRRKLNEVINEIYANPLNEYSIEIGNEEELALLQKSDCLHNCLGRLTSSEASLILRYYEYAGTAKITNRKKMAEEAGIPLNALRIRACRIRLKLLNCIRKCMDNSG